MAGLLASVGWTLAAPAGATARRSSRHGAPVVITVLSVRSDLVSGGEALVAIRLPPRAKRYRFKFTAAVGRRNVTGIFMAVSRWRREGLLTGLSVGRSVLSVRLPDGSGARLVITNHPSGGPVFSGPQLQPWTCEPGAMDRQCDKPLTYTYYYKSSDPLNSGLLPYDPSHPAHDVATTTTQTGVTVPFIVRVETGYIDRDQYAISVLFQPSKPWSAIAPQPQFAHKLLTTHGASCDIAYAPVAAPSVTTFNPLNLLGLSASLPSLGADSVHYALGQGFAVMSTALDNSGHDCDVAIQAESLLIAKQRVIDRYGTLRYTIGTGCSGGSLAQQWIANAYPGIYQGILPTCSFPDAWSSATQVMDYHLLRVYLEQPSKWGAGIAWLPTQWAAVEGNLLPLDAIVSDVGFFDAIVPTHTCHGLSASARYNPVFNPGGARCDIADLALNIFGPEQRSVWSSNEVKLGHGFAGVPVDNVGVQYGLAALRLGQIAPAQFADLNLRIGGLNIDINPTASRIAAREPALANAYRSGMINETNNMGGTAIIDCRGPDPGLAHDSYRAFAVRARLGRANGTHANQLIWEGPAPIVGDADCTQTSLIAMDRWLGEIERDTSARPLAQKVIADRPADLTDECWDGLGTLLSHSLCGQAIVPTYGTPRTVAGDGITTDANKCQLKPLRHNDYPVAFTGAEWAELQQAFPTGVCDFSHPGVHQQSTIPWLTYQDARGGVIYGGQPLGPAPVSRPFG